MAVRNYRYISSQEPNFQPTPTKSNPNPAPIYISPELPPNFQPTPTKSNPNPAPINTGGGGWSQENQSAPLNPAPNFSTPTGDAYVDTKGNITPTANNTDMVSQSKPTEASGVGGFSTSKGDVLVTPRGTVVSNFNSSSPEVRTLNQKLVQVLEIYKRMGKNKQQGYHSVKH
jgi:hypothetical protein